MNGPRTIYRIVPSYSLILDRRTQISRTQPRLLQTSISPENMVHKFSVFVSYGNCHVNNLCALLFFNLLDKVWSVFTKF